ncbi:unnamed protein product [Orchesella dallaii]|uniref:Uncharacterized protein n=1 Tax=Orchesella dallaii TaxID=48710 RepID=A0ABP1RHS1_9HEXA
MKASLILLIGNFSNGKWADNLVSIVANVLDQPPIFGSDLYNKSCYGCVWFLMLVVLCGAYRGKMFSHLTQASEPKWPANLGEILSDSDVKFVTLTPATNVVDGREILKGSALNEMLISKHSKELSLLNNKVFYYQYNLNRLLLDLVSSSPSFSSKFNVSRVTLVDFRKYAVNLKRALMIVRGKVKVASNPVNIDGLSLIYVWISNGICGTIFSNGLAQLEESGIVRRWIENKEIIQSFRFLHRVYDEDRSEKKLMMVDPSVGFKCGPKRKCLLQSMMNGDISKGLGKSENTTLSLNLFGNLIKMVGISLLVAGVVIVLENLDAAIRKGSRYL